MHGERLQMWLKKLKSAVLTKNLSKVTELLESLPENFTKEDAIQASYLLAEATNVAKELRDEVGKDLLQVKKNIDFLKSTVSPRKTKFDVTF